MNDRIDSFWEWFQQNATALLSVALQAERHGDVEMLDGLASTIHEQIAKISEELLVDVHVDSHEVALAVRTGLPDRSLVDQVLARAPRMPRWTFGSSIPQDLDSILVRTQDGRALSFEYAALGFEILFDQPDDRARIELVLDDDFDPDGPDALVFHDVATHVLTTFLGGIPEGIVSYRLIPARLARQYQTRPIFELTDAWRSATMGR